jgi:hypothetical protein
METSIWVDSEVRSNHSERGRRFELVTAPVSDRESPMVPPATSPPESSTDVSRLRWGIGVAVAILVAALVSAAIVAMGPTPATPSPAATTPTDANATARPSPTATDDEPNACVAGDDWHKNVSANPLTKDAYLDFGVHREGGTAYLYVRNGTTGNVDLFTVPLDDPSATTRVGVALSARADVGVPAVNYPDVVRVGPDRYRLYVVDESSGNVRYATAASPRGPWTLQPGVVMSGSPDDIQVLYEPDTERPYKLFYNAGAPRLATSQNGTAFANATDGPLLASGYDGSRIKDQDVVRSNGRYVMYYVNGYNGTLGMAVSTDLTNWTDYGDSVLTHPHPYEKVQIHTPRFVEGPVDGTWYLFYGAADERTWYERQMEDENVHESVAYATSGSLYEPPGNGTLDEVVNVSETCPAR